MSARFSIGIDLGTTNSALAFVPLEGDGGSAVLPIPQWETLSRLTEVTVLPSFLYLPEDAVAGQLAGRDAGRGEWVVGRLARNIAGERPGRVAHAAKSWLCHPGADHAAPFLPWGSDEIAPERKLSPIRASALILNALRAAWDSRFAGDGARFDDQEITITVPASFDAGAQRLTLAAAAEAGFPATVRLLEEPQAAFYAWLEGHDAVRDLWHRLSGDAGGAQHILVVDIGGGTSDFSLFEIRATSAGPLPAIRRIAVSDHILLGGDNIDLAIAHRVERRLVEAGGKLKAAQWDYLVARCRDLKERALAVDGPPEDVFPIVVPGQGAGLVAGTLAAQMSRPEIEAILFDGFFPACDADARAYKPLTALREWGLPFAADSAVTRHLAGFLAGRPRADAVLFNGGSLTPPALRRRLSEQIGAWQDGAAPLVLDNAAPELAVARGAARFGALVHRKGARIAAGAAHAVFLALQRAAPTDADAQAAAVPLVCILPHGAAPEVTFEVSEPAMELRVNRPVRFQTYTSTRHEGVAAGTVLAWNAGDFRPLPPLETIARLDTGRPDSRRRGDETRTLPVVLSASLNELGLLQVSLRSTNTDIRRSWPLDFNLRPRRQGDALRDADDPVLPAEPGAAALVAEPNVSAAAMIAAGQRLRALFTSSTGRPGKLSGGRAFKDLEAALGLPKADWNWVVNRTLWPALEEGMAGRSASVEHEEAWLILAGFLLRPGFGAAGDEARIDALWRLQETGLCFPGKRIRAQAHILWRRVAGGLDRDRQQRLRDAGIETVRSRSDAPPELVLLLGSLERISHEAKAELIERFLAVGLERARANLHAAPYFAALGLLLNRAPLYAGPETVVPPELVERAFAALAPLDWRDPALAELATLFLRATRVVDDRSLDLPPGVRQRIAARLEKSGVSPLRVAKLRDFMPMERSERLGLYGEALPPGLLLRGDA